MEDIREFWRDYYKTVVSQSNEAPVTDSEITEDHKCRPMDPQSMTIHSHPAKWKNEVRGPFSIGFR